MAETTITFKLVGESVPHPAEAELESVLEGLLQDAVQDMMVMDIPDGARLDVVYKEKNDERYE